MFSLRRLLAITTKELRHITRDVRIFFLVALSPALLLLVLAYIFAFDAGSVDLAWLDEDRSATSRAYLAHLTSDGDFQLARVATGQGDVEAALLAGQVDVAVIVPSGFESDLLAGRTAKVQAIADGTDAVTIARALGNLAGRTAAFGASQARLPDIIQVRVRAWYNSRLAALWGMVPGLMAIVLTLPALALTLAVTRESEIGTLEALIASPISGAEYQIGKLLAYVLSGLLSAALAVVVAVFWFGVPFRGSFALFLSLAVLFYLACMGASLLIARFVTSQQTAMLLVLLVFFVPGFFIAGLIQPVDTSSLPAQITSYSMPVTHFIAIARGILLKGNTVAQLRFHAGSLAAMAFVGVGLSLLLFRKRLG